MLVGGGLFFSCNLTYKVRNQHSTLEDFLFMPCGKVSLELIGKGNSKFTFRQHFLLDESVTLHGGALMISYNEQILQPVISLSKPGKNGSEIWQLSGHEIIEHSFVLEDGVFEGDTIKIFSSGYLNCREQIMDIDTLVYSFTNNFRILGVNR